MILEKIKLINFRNYLHQEINFGEGINFIFGENASGKTNLIEGIYFLSLSRSFKKNKEAELIQKNYNNLFIQGVIRSESVDKIEIYSDKNAKKITINGKSERKISSLTKYINCIVFRPEDTSLFKNSPSIRRSLLNLSISKVSETYRTNLLSYEKILLLRNDELKKESVNEKYIEVLTDQLIKLCYSIDKERHVFLSQINKHISSIFNDISGYKSKVVIRNKYFVNDFENYLQEAKVKFINSYSEDLRQKVTTNGIHKEDFELLIDGRNVGLSGSQGENRMASIAFKLSMYFLQESKMVKPIILLDDVLSELDENHEERLINHLRNYEQVFITSSKRTKYKFDNVYKVKNGAVQKENDNG